MKTAPIAHAATIFAHAGSRVRFDVECSCGKELGRKLSTDEAGALASEHERLNDLTTFGAWAFERTQEGGVRVLRKEDGEHVVTFYAAALAIAGAYLGTSRFAGSVSERSAEGKAIREAAAILLTEVHETAKAHGTNSVVLETAARFDQGLL